MHDWWRWPLLPVAAILGAILGSGLWLVIQWLLLKFYGGAAEDGWIYRYVLPTVSSGIFGWLFVSISCRVAPRGKVIAGTVMTTILVLLGLANLFVVWWRYGYDDGLEDAIMITVNWLICSAAGVAALINAQSDH